MAMTLKEVDFGEVDSGSVFKIEVPPAQGFFANALLTRDGKKVASWESDELTGQVVERKASAAGDYTLRVTLAFTGRDAVAVAIKLTATLPDSSLVTKTLSFTGQNGDIGRAKVFAEVKA
jgi:hypothetical protein